MGSVTTDLSVFLLPEKVERGGWLARPGMNIRPYDVLPVEIAKRVYTPFNIKGGEPRLSEEELCSIRAPIPVMDWQEEGILWEEECPLWERSWG
jgi:hypothetical protein